MRSACGWVRLPRKRPAPEVAPGSGGRQQMGYCPFGCWLAGDPLPCFKRSGLSDWLAPLLVVLVSSWSRHPNGCLALVAASVNVSKCYQILLNIMHESYLFMYSVLQVGCI